MKHSKPRVYIMHAGYPLLDDLLAVLYGHPQVYVDVGIIVYNLPRPAFTRYLQAIVEAGFTNRVMFGSDQMVWPGTIDRAIAVIADALIDETIAVLQSYPPMYVNIGHSRLHRKGTSGR